MLNIIVTLLDLKCLLEILCLADSFLVLISFQNKYNKTFLHVFEMHIPAFAQDAKDTIYTGEFTNKEYGADSFRKHT